MANTNTKQQSLPLSTPMEEAVLAKVAVMLKGIKAQYVIVTAGGEKHTLGNLKLEQPKKKAASTQPFGTYTSLVRSAGFEDMKVSDVITIDCGNLDPESVRGTATAMACTKWGKKTVFTNINGSKVELMRLA